MTGTRRQGSRPRPPRVPVAVGAGRILTRASVDDTRRFPGLAPEASPGGEQAPAGRKYGGCDEDAEVFGWIREGAPDGRPCLEAQVMGWADDVAYSVHDLEDGLH